MKDARAAVLGSLLTVLVASSAGAQPPKPVSAGTQLTSQLGTLRTTRPTPVRERPRGDSAVVGTVAAGQVLEILTVQGVWYEVLPPAEARSQSPWRRGWVHSSAVMRQGAAAGQQARRRGELTIRGFGQLGGTLFTARDSFEMIFRGSFGPFVAAGGQVGFPNGAFLQASVGRFEDTGTLAVVSGDQVFRLETAHQVTLNPTLFSVGYRDAGARRLVYYLGAGGGWYRLREEFQSVEEQRSVTESHAGYHVMGGVEYPLLPWVALSGEVQWSTVPGILGEGGVSAAFAEDNLGGTTLALKLMVGR